MVYLYKEKGRRKWRGGGGTLRLKSVIDISKMKLWRVRNDNEEWSKARAKVRKSERARTKVRAKRKSSREAHKLRVRAKWRRVASERAWSLKWKPNKQCSRTYFENLNFSRALLCTCIQHNLMVFSVLHYPQTFLIVFSAVYVCVFFFSFPPSSNSWFIGPEKDKIMLVYRVWPCRQFNKMLGTLVVSVLWQTLKNLLFLFVLWRTTKTHKNCMYLCNLNKEERRRGNSDQQSILILACDRLSARLVASNANRAYWLPCATNRAPFHTLCLTFFPLCFC